MSKRVTTVTEIEYDEKGRVTKETKTTTESEDYFNVGGGFGGKDLYPRWSPSFPSSPHIWSTVNDNNGSVLKGVTIP